MQLDGIRNIYLLGDLHLGIKNGSIEWFNIQRHFLINWFIDSIKKDGFDPDQDILIQLGDVNHIRESINTRIDNESEEIFEKLSNIFKKGVYILIGNHDIYYKDRTDINSLKKIPKLYKNIHILEKPEILIINGSHKFLMAPWEHDISILTDTIKKYKDKSDYLMCHADINEFSLNKWTKIQSGLNRTDLNSFKRIYAGHIHIRQSNNNITYIGTPYQLDRGDFGNVKGFYKLSIKGDELEETFIENTESPEFVKIDAKKMLNMNINEITEYFNDNFVEILIDNNMAKVFPINRFIELVENCGHRSLEFIPYALDELNLISDDLVYSYDYNMFEILNEYLKIREISADLTNRVSVEFKNLYDKINQNRNNNEI
jgi:UDP-2,3-diacylglucosamine pyrophosphatase LpxH